MYKIICLLFTVFIVQLNVCASESQRFEAGISVNDVPLTLFGTWRVSAKLDNATDYSVFKPQSTDIWTLSRINNKLILSNPFTGASAEVTINSISSNLVVFSKKAPYNNKTLTDTVAIRIEKDNFHGLNTLNLQTVSSVDGQILKNDSAKYIIKGEKIAGETIIEN